MIAEVRLLLNEISEEEYRREVERGIQLPIARPGWSRRFVLVVRAIVLTAVFMALLFGVPAAIYIVGVANDLDVAR